MRKSGCENFSQKNKNQHCGTTETKGPLSVSVRPKPGFGIGNRNQDQVSVSVSGPELFLPKPKISHMLKSTKNSVQL